jgi:hypothetical protein
VISGPSLGLALTLACANPSPNPSASEGGSSDTDASSSTAGEDLPDDDNSLPPVPSLLSPADGASGLPIELELCWNLVEDPDGDPVRYRLFVDDMPLGNGRLADEEGHAGPCVGPLLFAHERSYAWQVEAFEVADPTRSSGRSAAWSFSTIGDGLSATVFVDDFEADLGWTVGGDAFAGAWVRGEPVATLHGELSSQPGVCAAGSACYFTGQNPDAVADDEDVAGGATILTSPEFDLGGAAIATVRLQRFFYKSELMADAALEVELLTPNPAVPEGYDVHPLEQLTAATGEAPANAWTPREYAVCDAPMLDGSRLRIRASDHGSGILEAAIDSVSVHAHADASLCEPGEGGWCDPAAGPMPCPSELLCCSQGAVNLGIHRCEPPVAGLDYTNPTDSPAAPGNGALGCDAPDLIVDPVWIEPLIFTDIFMTDDSCELYEGCVGGVGWRTVMLFTVATPNIGSRDLALGVPANLPELFHYSECHDHHHFDEFARYELRDGDVVVAVGHKQAFCLLDVTSWAWPLALGQFDCTNQGVSRGFSDFYEAGLPCQWIDVTDTPPGEYTLRVTLNQPRLDHAIPALNERDYSNNVAEIQVVIP